MYAKSREDKAANTILTICQMAKQTWICKYILYRFVIIRLSGAGFIFLSHCPRDLQKKIDPSPFTISNEPIHLLYIVCFRLIAAIIWNGSEN